jgi:hypothetical protein
VANGTEQPYSDRTTSKDGANRTEREGTLLSVGGHRTERSTSESRSEDNSSKEQRESVFSREELV